MAHANVPQPIKRNSYISVTPDFGLGYALGFHGPSSVIDIGVHLEAHKDVGHLRRNSSNRFLPLILQGLRVSVSTTTLQNLAAAALPSCFLGSVGGSTH